MEGSHRILVYLVKDCGLSDSYNSCFQVFQGREYARARELMLLRVSRHFVNASGSLMDVAEGLIVEAVDDLSDLCDFTHLALCREDAWPWEQDQW